MAKLTINGKSVTVDDSFLSLSPEEQNATVDEIAASLGSSQPQQPQVSTTEDVLKSGGAGLARGAIEIPGLIGDTQQLVGNIAGGAARMFGAGEEFQAGVRDKAARLAIPLPGVMGNLAPTSEQLTGAVESATGEFYEPQTTAGEFAQTTGRFIPSTMMGPGTKAMKLGVGVASGLASEGAGQATEGTAAEPYARVAGAIAGGVPVAANPLGAIKNKLAESNAFRRAPDQADVAQQVTQRYKDIADRNIQFDGPQYQGFVDDILAAFSKIGKEAAPVASSYRQSAVDLLKGEGGKTITDPLMGGRQTVIPDKRTVAYNDLEEIRRNASEASADLKLSDTERKVASELVGRIEGLYKTVPGLDEQLGTAKELARRNILVKQLEKMKDKSEWYLSGNESGLKNQVSAFGKQKGHTLTSAEKAAYQNIVRKEGLNNFISTAGGRLGQLILGGTGATLGSALGPLGVVGGVVSAGAGHTLARKLSEKSTTKAIDKAIKTALLGKDGQKKLPAPLIRTGAEVQALISALNGAKPLPQVSGR